MSRGCACRCCSSGATLPAFAAAVGEARTRMAANSVNIEFLPGLIYLQARAAWEQGDLAQIEASLDELAEQQTMPLVTTEDEIRRLLLQGLIALSTRKFVAGRARAAPRCRPASERPPYRFSARSALGAGCLIRRHGADLDDALAVLEPALIDIRQRGMPGILLQEGDHILPLLRLAQEQNIETELLAPTHRDYWIALLLPRSLAIPGSSETLSPRETEVLHLMIAGASNREIAETLVITERTVKAHVTHILSKLGVTSRTQAAARSHELHLL